MRQDSELFGSKFLPSKKLIIQLFKAKNRNKIEGFLSIKFGFLKLAKIEHKMRSVVYDKDDRKISSSTREYENLFKFGYHKIIIKITNSLRYTYTRRQDYTFSFRLKKIEESTCVVYYKFQVSLNIDKSSNGA